MQFFSRKLIWAEMNNMGNREVHAINAALEKWPHWLEGVKFHFIILADHKNLEYIKSAKRLNPGQTQ